MELTNDAKQRYLKGRGTHCPFCGSEQIEGSHVEVDGGRAVQPIGCLICDKEWSDIYTLDDVVAGEG